jgi:hypothetical protein
MPIATIAPIATSHQGELGGRLSARRQPVTAADKSLMVTFVFSMNFWIKYSTKTQEMTPTSTNLIAENPKK